MSTMNCGFNTTSELPRWKSVHLPEFTACIHQNQSRSHKLSFKLRVHVGHMRPSYEYVQGARSMRKDTRRGVREGAHQFGCHTGQLECALFLSYSLLMSRGVNYCHRHEFTVDVDSSNVEDCLKCSCTVQRVDIWYKPIMISNRPFPRLVLRVTYARYCLYRAPSLTRNGTITRTNHKHSSHRSEEIDLCFVLMIMVPTSIPRALCEEATDGHATISVLIQRTDSGLS